jgi:hypothetical protein
MRILETNNGKVVAEIEGRYYTRVVFANNHNVVGTYRPPAHVWPIQMPCHPHDHRQWMGKPLRVAK